MTASTLARFGIRSDPHAVGARYGHGPGPLAFPVRQKKCDRVNVNNPSVSANISRAGEMTFSPPQIPATPVKILIVEDEGLVADNLADLLSSDGYRVVGIAESSEGALELVPQLMPDLILMDVRIKGSMDGIATTAKLREHFDIPVVYLTAHTDHQTVDRAKTTGAFGYLTKPVYPMNLSITIEMAIHKHRADRAMRNQRSWMATVLSTMADAMAVIDSDRKVQFLNGPAEALTGWTNEQCRDVDIATVLRLRDAVTDADVDELLTPPYKPQPPSELPRDLVASKRNGRTFPIEGALAPSVDEGRVVGAVVTFRDATSRKARDNEIRHMDKMHAVGRLAAGIAHDFNNLLFVILGYSDELISAGPDDHGLHALREIQKAGRSAASLTQQLLKFSRKQSVEQQDVDLNAVIRDTEELFRRVGGPSVTWRFKLDRDLGVMQADPGQLKQVLMNLVSNARDAMGGSGRITIETSNVDVPRLDAAEAEAEQFIALSVTDTGAGMSAETAEHLFEPFFTTKQPGGGTGLGLSIVHTIVTDHGGTINVDSTPGNGATFTMYFPRIAAAAVRPALPAATTSGVSDAVTVLLVEDQDNVRGLLREYLLGAGYTVVEASDGEEAVRIANDYSGQIDVVVTDVMMPGLNGFEVARNLSIGRPEIKIIFISGYAQELVDSVANLPQGARFLPKPFGKTELLQKVSSLLLGREKSQVFKAS